MTINPRVWYSCQETKVEILIKNHDFGAKFIKKRSEIDIRTKKSTSENPSPKFEIGTWKPLLKIENGLSKPLSKNQNRALKTLRTPKFAQNFTLKTKICTKFCFPDTELTFFYLNINRVYLIWGLIKTWYY